MEPRSNCVATDSKGKLLNFNALANVLQTKVDSALASCRAIYAKLNMSDVVVFVGADHDVSTTTWARPGVLGNSTTVIYTAGNPLHTGRDVNASKNIEMEDELYEKTLVDFFLLTETTFFLSNCQHSYCPRSRCGNSFAYNVHLHRSPAAEALEFPYPGFQCHEGPDVAAVAAEHGLIRG